MSGKERPGFLTTTAGAPVTDNQHSITAGPRGPILIQDYHLVEKLAHSARANPGGSSKPRERRRSEACRLPMTARAPLRRVIKAKRRSRTIRNPERASGASRHLRFVGRKRHLATVADYQVPGERRGSAHGPHRQTAVFDHIRLPCESDERAAV